MSGPAHRVAPLPARLLGGLHRATGEVVAWWDQGTPGHAAARCVTGAAFTDPLGPLQLADMRSGVAAGRWRRDTWRKAYCWGRRPLQRRGRNNDGRWIRWARQWHNHHEELSRICRDSRQGHHRSSDEPAKSCAWAWHGHATAAGSARLPSVQLSHGGPFSATMLPSGSGT